MLAAKVLDFEASLNCTGINVVRISTVLPHTKLRWGLLALRFAVLQENMATAVWKYSKHQASKREIDCLSCWHRVNSHSHTQRTHGAECMQNLAG